MNILDQLFGIKGRVALVTGGSSGIGRAIAFCLAEAGAAVIHVARKEEALKEAVKDIEKVNGMAAYLTCDVSDMAALTELAEKSASFFGTPDILVNGAGVNMRQSWEDISSNSWDKQIDINLKAPFFLARHLIPAMKEKRWGKIINIASLQSERLSICEQGQVRLKRGFLWQGYISGKIGARGCSGTPTITVVVDVQKVCKGNFISSRLDYELQ
jgi:NAD(P)-dependent dehydrogenase (short-subunit alcohol dehydrogenase family)